jgi:opacity protein-like surface antigen
MKRARTLSLLVLPLASVLSISCGVAQADEVIAKPASDSGYTQGFYAALGLSVGFGTRAPIVDSSDSSFSNEYWTTSTTLGPNVGVGYGFGQGWRAELEYLGYYPQATNHYTRNGRAAQVSGNQVATNAVQLNLLKDIATGSKFTPYIGGGVGFASSQYNVQEGSVSGTDFAGQGKVGVSYAISKTTSAYLGYRIMGIGGGTRLTFWSDQPRTGSRLQQGLDAGIRIKL